MGIEPTGTAFQIRLPGPLRQRHFIDEPNLGRRFQLKVNLVQGDKLRTGARTRVRGNAAGNALSADFAADAVTVLAKPLAAAPLTARKAVVLLVEIRDSTGVVQTVSANCDGAAAKSRGK